MYKRRDCEEDNKGFEGEYRPLIPKYDTVEKPKHYNRSIEVIDFIEAYDLNYRLGNVVKYIARHELKHDDLDKQIEDLKKAKWYLDREIRSAEIGERIKNLAVKVEKETTVSEKVEKRRKGLDSK